MIPDVSVIIPAYNTEEYIAQAIESALSQTLTNIEVIVVDDASTDQTVDIVQKFTDPRLQLLKNSHNRGVSAARNRALSIARGRWIAVLDSDDWYAPRRLETLLEISETQKLDIIIDNLYLIQAQASSAWGTLLGESGETIRELKVVDPVFYVKTGVYGKRGLHLGLCKPFFRRSFLTEHHLQYDENQQVVEDFQLILKCLLAGALMVFNPEPYYFYRSRPGSLVTQSKVKHIEQFGRIIPDFIQKAQAQNNTELVAALSESLSVLEKNRSYYRVVEPLKQGHIWHALKEAMRNPYFWVHFMNQTRAILWRRYRYYILKDKRVYEITYQEKINR